MKKINPAAGNRSEVGDATAWWPHPDLKPIGTRLKKGYRYLLHFCCGEEYEAPPSERWAKRTVTVTVVAIGPGWIDERALTYNNLYFNNANEPVRDPVRPQGLGWNFEGPVAPRSSAWRRRREVSE